MQQQTIAVGSLDDLDDPGCREFRIGEGDWPFRGFVVRCGDEIFAYQNRCSHAGLPLNWEPDKFLTLDGTAIICSSHGAMYAPDTGVCFAGPCRGQSLERVAVKVRDRLILVTAPRRMQTGH